MEMERQRQAHSKEIESKDEEVDEIRRSCGKKVGTLQSRLSRTFSDLQVQCNQKCIHVERIQSLKGLVQLRDFFSLKYIVFIKRMF